MGKYWYNDNGKWRIGDDDQDAAIGIVIALLIGLFWVIIFPIKWISGSEQPPTWKKILWGIVLIAYIALAVYLLNEF